LSTTGDVPLKWYDDFEHIGYDIEGEPVRKPAKEDLIDEFIAINENKNSWRTVFDEKTGQRVILSDRDVEYIKRLQRGILPERYDADKWFIPVATSKPDIMPTSAQPEPKSRFVPSKWEASRIRKLAYAIKKGWIKLDKEEKKKEPDFYLIWDEGTGESRSSALSLPPPKMRLPGHEESYNPPAEYLWTEEEVQAWKDTSPEERRQNFIPRKYNSLRQVPSYSNYHRERFERSLDLYLCARVKRKKPRLDMQKLMPQIPKPSELRPFPSVESLQYLGHSGRVRSVSVDPLGQWLVSGSDDKTLRLWEIRTGRCVKVWSFDSTVYSVDWNKNSELSLIAVALESQLVLVQPPTASRSQQDRTEMLFSGAAASEENPKAYVHWAAPDTASEEWADGIRQRVQYKRTKFTVKQVVWHHKGDYLATVTPEATSAPVFIHQITKRQSQSPFSKTKGKVQTVRFHPSKPFFFVATERTVRVYNLVKQNLMKKLLPGVQWISSLDIHPGGDNLLVGSYDKKACWFDMDLSVKPYKTLRYHEYCIRAVQYHSRYPLFATCSDDGTVQVFHATVYNDLLNNALIIPLKILRGHEVVDDLGVLDIAFHPAQPWIFSAGADHTIRLYV
jgi:ribosome biogenesis protein ERB1